MDTMDIVYDFSILGLVLIPEDRAIQTVKMYEAALEAASRTKSVYDYENMEPGGLHYWYYINIEPGNQYTLTGDVLRPYQISNNTKNNSEEGKQARYSQAKHIFPEIAMSSWMPKDVQDEFGNLTHYYSIDDNELKGDIQIFSDKKATETIQALEKKGFHCRRDGYLVWQALVGTLASDLEVIMDLEEEEEVEEKWASLEEYVDDPYTDDEDDFEAESEGYDDQVIEESDDEEEVN